MFHTTKTYCANVYYKTFNKCTIEISINAKKELLRMIRKIFSRMVIKKKQHEKAVLALGKQELHLINVTQLVKDFSSFVILLMNSKNVLLVEINCSWYHFTLCKGDFNDHLLVLMTLA